MSELSGVTRSDLIRDCLLKIQRQSPRSSSPSLYLVRPGVGAKGGGRMPRGFPRGELLCVNGNGERVYRYPALRVLQFALERMERDPEGGAA